MLGHNPQIVTNNLVCMLDAKNTKSYIGSGVTWTDISGKGNTGTLINGPTFSSGIIYFDGVDDYVNCGASVNLDFTTTFSLGIWLKPNAQMVGSGYFAILDKVNVGGNGYYIFMRDAKPIVSIQGDTNYAWSSTSCTAGNWYYIMATYDNVNIKMYLNGKETATTPKTMTITTHTSPLEILSRTAGLSKPNNYKSNGYVGSIHAYNRCLTASEVFQNFNALRGRYGI